MLSTVHMRWLAVIASCFMVACADSADTPVKAAPTTASSATQAVNISFKSDPSPLRSGDNTVEVSVANADGSPLNDATVTATFYMAAMPSMNMPEMRSVFALKSEGNGRYRGDGQLVMGGSWDVTINVTRSGEKLGSKKLAVIAK